MGSNLRSARLATVLPRLPHFRSKSFFLGFPGFVAYSDPMRLISNRANQIEDEPSAPARFAAWRALAGRCRTSD
jgi:hypothetical protein